jgi:hypothetical protein
MAGKSSNPLASLGKIFSPVTDPFCIIGHFSDLASKNTEPLASLASVLKNLSTPLLQSMRAMIGK